MSTNSLVVIIFVGIVAGWLAGKIVDGGVFGDLIVGVIGAFIGNWLVPQLNIHLGVGIIAQIANATIGAILLLFIIRVLAGTRGWGGGWGNGWGAVGVVGGRRMTEDGNVEITGRDLREAAQGASKRASLADIVAG